MLSSKQYVILVITAMAGFVGTHALGHIRFIGRESLMTTFIYIYMVFTTDGFFEVAIESWPEWGLNPQPLNSVQTL